MSQFHQLRVGRAWAGLFALALAALACTAPAASNGSGGPTAAPTALPATAQPTSAPSAIPAPALHHVIVQNKDLSLSTYGLDGQSTPFGKIDFQLGAGQYAEYGVASGKLVAMSGYSTPDKPVQFYAIDSSGAQPLAAQPHLPQGFAVWTGLDQQPARVAWGEVDYLPIPTAQPGGATPAPAFPPTNGRLMVADVTATTAKVAYQTVSNQGLYLSPIRWTPDGQHLFYSLEPSGLGGYILFGGHSSLYNLDVASGQSTELITFDQQHTTICLDDLSPDFTLISSHCDRQITVINLQTQQKTVIKPPDGFPADQIGQEGDAMFSPDGKRVAYAMAHADPENEQGWVAVTDDLSGPSHLVATSPAKTWYSVLGWLDDSHILLAEHAINGDNWDTIQVVGLDGAPPRDLAKDSNFVAFAP